MITALQSDLMKKKFRQFTTLKLILMLFVLVIISIACITSGKLMTLNLSEKNLNKLIGNPRITLEDGYELEVVNLEIQDGYIRVYGTLEKDNQPESAGFFDLNLTVSDGKIAADIINIEFDGIDTTGGISDLNGDFFERMLNQQVEQRNQRVLFEEIIYVPDGIQFRFRIPSAPTSTIIE